MAIRSRRFIFTVNNWDEEDYKIWETLECRYMVMGKEVGEQGTPHLQGYVEFVNARSFNSMRSINPKAHIEVAHGDAEQNLKYCSKEGDFIVRGTPSMSRSDKGVLEKRRWEDAKASAIAGDLDNVPGDIYVRCYSSLKAIKKDHMPAVQDLDGVCGLWLYGEPKNGKSDWARKRFGTNYFVKDPATKWWDGYQNEEVIIIDEVDRTNCMGLSNRLKIWADMYAFIAEDKGGAFKIRPKHVIVTSNYKIEDLFAELDPVTLSAVLRRFSQEYVPHWKGTLRDRSLVVAESPVIVTTPQTSVVTDVC